MQRQRANMYVYDAHRAAFPIQKIGRLCHMSRNLGYWAITNSPLTLEQVLYSGAHGRFFLGGKATKSCHSLLICPLTASSQA